MIDYRAHGPGRFDVLSQPKPTSLEGGGVVKHNAPLSAGQTPATPVRATMTPDAPVHHCVETGQVPEREANALSHLAGALANTVGNVGAGASNVAKRFASSLDALAAESSRVVGPDMGAYVTRLTNELEPPPCRASVLDIVGRVTQVAISTGASVGDVISALTPVFDLRVSCALDTYCCLDLIHFTLDQLRNVPMPADHVTFQRVMYDKIRVFDAPGTTYERVDIDTGGFLNLSIGVLPGATDLRRIDGIAMVRRRTIEEDLRGIHDDGVRLIVSMVETLPAPYYEAADKVGVRLHRQPTTDFTAPDMAATIASVEAIVAAAQAGEGVLIHCLSGRGRSGTLAACVLVAQGWSPPDAIAAVRQQRFGAVETLEQTDFVYDFANAWGTPKS